MAGEKEFPRFNTNDPLFINVKRILDEEDFSIKEIVDVLDDLESFEGEVRKLRHLIFEATYSRVVSSLISPIDELFESEYQKDK